MYIQSVQPHNNQVSFQAIKYSNGMGRLLRKKMSPEDYTKFNQLVETQAENNVDLYINFDKQKHKLLITETSPNGPKVKHFQRIFEKPMSLIKRCCKYAEDRKFYNMLRKYYITF